MIDPWVVRFEPGAARDHVFVRTNDPARDRALWNPRGRALRCLNTKLARARLRVHVVGRGPLKATSTRAALEIGTHDRDHGVRMRA